MEKNELYKYYWGYQLKNISEKTGLSPKVVHSKLKWRFCHDLIKGTSGMNKEEFNEYLFEVIDFAEKEYEVKLMPPENQ